MVGKPYLTDYGTVPRDSGAIKDGSHRQHRRARDEKLETKRGTLSDLYLMEARSLGRLSGSPVYMDVLRAIVGKEGVTLIDPVRGPRFRLLGMISGHYTGVDDELGSTAIELREIWKKQADGKWRCIVDTYNSDLPVPAAPEAKK